MGKEFFWYGEVNSPYQKYTIFLRQWKEYFVKKTDFFRRNGLLPHHSALTFSPIRDTL